MFFFYELTVIDWDRRAGTPILLGCQIVAEIKESDFLIKYISGHTHLITIHYMYSRELKDVMFVNRTVHIL